MTTRDMFNHAVPLEEPRRAAFDVDYTPPAVVEQILRAVLAGWRRLGDPRPIRALDFAAGAGVWSMVLRRLLVEMGRHCDHITAVEVRAEERANLRRHCDVVFIGDAVGFGGDRRNPKGYDLIMGNTPFSLPDTRAKRARRDDGEWGEGKSRQKAYETFVVAGRSMLAQDDSRLVLYVPADWWQRAGPLAVLSRDHQPYRQLNVPLPVRHRAKGGSATDAYCAYVWAHPDRPAASGWHTTDLPILEPLQRRWSVVPGTERGNEASGSEEP